MRMALLYELQVRDPAHVSSPAFEAYYSGGQTPILIFCDHASNFVPPSVGGGSLGLPDADMNRHIAYDVGAQGVSLRLADLLKGQAIFSCFSRLVIDPNRGEDDPTLVMKLYDGTIIPANRHVDAAEVERRLDAFHRPYHKAAAAMLDTMIAQSRRTPIIVSIHSFTPQFKGRPLRPWHIGLLTAEDRRLAEPLLDRLAQEPDLIVGDNEPYHGKLEGDCMATHGIARGLPHILIELRNDLITAEADQIAWADRLAPMLMEVFTDFWKHEEPTHG